MTNKSNGWIYVLDDQLGHYKIGKAADLNRRVKQLRIQLPYPVTIHYAFQTTDQHSDEQVLHELFATKRLNGEWFRLDLEDLATIYEHCDFTGFYEWGGQLVADPLCDTPPFTDLPVEPYFETQAEYEKRMVELWAEDDFYHACTLAAENAELADEVVERRHEEEAEYEDFLDGLAEQEVQYEEGHLQAEAHDFDDGAEEEEGCFEWETVFKSYLVGQEGVSHVV